MIIEEEEEVIPTVPTVPSEVPIGPSLEELMDIINDPIEVPPKVKIPDSEEYMNKKILGPQTIVISAVVNFFDKNDITQLLKWYNEVEKEEIETRVTKLNWCMFILNNTYTKDLSEIVKQIKFDEKLMDAKNTFCSENIRTIDIDPFIFGVYKGRFSIKVHFSKISKEILEKSDIQFLKNKITELLDNDIYSYEHPEGLYIIQIFT